MKSVSLLLLLILLCDSHAEVFIGPTTPPNRLVVEQGEAILISFLTDGARDDPFTAILDFGGEQLPVSMFSEYANLNLNALAGPSELVFTNSALVSFKRVQTPAIRTLVVSTNSNSLIEVPANRTIKFFGEVGVNGTLLEITKGAHRAPSVVSLK